MNPYDRDEYEPSAKGPGMNIDGREQLLRLAGMRMPYGKHTGCLLVDLPETYVVWMAQTGFPEGELGQMLQIVFEIKVNGLEYLFDPLRNIADRD